MSTDREMSKIYIMVESCIIKEHLRTGDVLHEVSLACSSLPLSFRGDIENSSRTLALSAIIDTVFIADNCS